MFAKITSFYAALLGLFFVFLSIRTLRLRRKNRIAIGDGDNPVLQRAVRVHANFAEYTLMAVLLVAFVESFGYSSIIVHVLLLAFVMGRFSHAFGVSNIGEDYRFRVFGMAMTFGVITISSMLIVAQYLL